jgi:hypothetical protein
LHRSRKTRFSGILGSKFWSPTPHHWGHIWLMQKSSNSKTQYSHERRNTESKSTLPHNIIRPITPLLRPLPRRHYHATLGLSSNGKKENSKQIPRLPFLSINIASTRTPSNRASFAVSLVSPSRTYSCVWMQGAPFVGAHALALLKPVSDAVQI